MESKYQIILGALAVSVVGALSMIANYPKIYSPYCFTVVLPTLYASAFELPTVVTYILGVLPLTIFYLIWSFSFTRPSYVIPKPAIVLILLLFTLSAIFNIASYKYGIEYQGKTHTLLMYGFNLLCIFLMTIIFKINHSNPSAKSNLGFNILLFSWLGWIAFPWLGELI